MNDGPETALGKKLCLLRAKIVAAGTPLNDWYELMDFATTEAVESERRECASLMVHAITAALARADGDSVASLRECRKKVLARGREAQPPAPEPMTVAKMIEKWEAGTPVFGDRFGWLEFKNDLTSLVEAQVRRDAEICLKMGAATAQQGITQRACYDAILESAGLKAKSTSLFGYQQRGES